MRPTRLRRLSFSQDQGRAVLADDESGLPLGQAEQEGGGAEVAVGDPQVLGGDALEQARQQGALLGVGVLAAEDVGGQLQLGLEDDQRLPRQGAGRRAAQLLEAALAGGQVVAVEDLGPVAPEVGGQGGLEKRQDGLESLGGVADQGLGQAGLGGGQLVVQRAHRDGDVLLVVPEGGVDGGVDAADDGGQQLDGGAEEQLLGVLALGGVPEQLVEDLGLEGAFQQAAHHHGHRALGDEAVEHLAAQHGSTSLESLAGDQGRFV
jgi:hypothetical protein